MRNYRIPDGGSTRTRLLSISLSLPRAYGALSRAAAGDVPFGHGKG
jgi:hypothetical protein